MKLSKRQINKAVRKPKWQAFRLKLKGSSTKTKKRMLANYLRANSYDEESKVQVQNYINALKRGGQI